MQAADLWPIALNTLETLMLDPKLSATNQLRAVELVARLTGNLNSETGVQVNVVHVGEQARAELRLLQGDGSAQAAALDELQRMTLPPQNGVGVHSEQPCPTLEEAGTELE